MIIFTEWLKPGGRMVPFVCGWALAELVDKQLVAMSAASAAQAPMSESTTQGGPQQEHEDELANMSGARA